MLSRSPDCAAPAEDLAACRRALCAGSKSFAAASRLLPRRVREDATVLYAFCREADDAVDVHDGGPAAIADLRDRLDRLYAGAPRAFAADRALAEVVRRHALPRVLLDALIEGFEWDAAGRRYETIEELCEYAARVAGTIGAMMAVLMGARAPAAVARACDLGVAMQLTNIARDVGDDARAGRLYLPLDAMREAGINPDRWIERPEVSDALRVVVRGLLTVADGLYARVGQGVAQLAPDCRPGINAARFIYAEIGHVVSRRRYDSVSQRAVVSRRRKLWLLGRSWLPVRAGDTTRIDGPLPATRYLVDAVCASAPANGARTIAAMTPWWRVRARALWVIDLFEQLERRERMPRDVDWLESGVQR